MAIDDINNKTNKVFDSLLPESELRAIVRLSSDEFFDGGVNARQVISVDSQGVKAALGPPSFANLKGAAPVLEQFGGIPLFSYGDRTSIFGNSELYPNVFRTIPSDYYDGYVLASVVGQFFRWKKVSVFSTNTDLGRGSALLFRHYAAEYGIKILSSHSLDASQEDYTSDISRAKHLGARIIVLFVEGPVAVRLMIQGSQVHFRNTLQILSGERLSYQHWAENGMTVQDFGFLTGYIGVKLRYYAPTSALKTHFLNKWKSQTDIISNNSSFSLNCDLTRDFYNQSYLYRYDPQPSAAAAAASGGNSTASICTGVQFSSYSQDVSLLDTLNDVMYAYDAVLAIAHGLHGLIYQQNTHNPSPTELYSYLLSDVSFTGLTGQVSFSTELKSDDFNVGGRATAVVYDLFNFVPNHTSSNPEDSFPVIATWHSETGIPKCHNVSYFVDGNPCYRIHFNTDKYTITNDSPDPIKRNTLPVYFSVILKIISLLGIAFVIICIVITVIYRKRRLVKMSQPLLTYLTLFGMSLAFVNVYLSAIELTDSSCVALLWLQQLAFQIIFGTVLIRAWRVNQITAALQKKRITDRTCSLYLLLRISPTLLLLFFVTLDQSIQKHFVSVIHTQYEYILEPCCDYNNTATLGMIMYLYDTVTILIGLKWCWNIRKVRSTICNTPSLVESKFIYLLLPPPSLHLQSDSLNRSRDYHSCHCHHPSCPQSPLTQSFGSAILYWNDNFCPHASSPLVI
jgi:hypothetical protein